MFCDLLVKVTLHVSLAFPVTELQAESLGLRAGFGLAGSLSPAVEGQAQASRAGLPGLQGFEPGRAGPANQPCRPALLSIAKGPGQPVQDLKT